MQKWEYTTITRKRIWKVGIGPLESKGWEADITPNIRDLGEQGWELVTVVPRSGWARADYAGFTSEEYWIFKRPKP